MMMSSCMKKLKFKIVKAENGYEAFYKVRRFIENYDRVRQQISQPGASCKHLNKEELKLIRSTLQNFDVIILDLNMPIMNGYNACERICEIYNQFNNLPDFDEL
jgi:CheY-like chemotaxis protein